MCRMSDDLTNLLRALDLLSEDSSDKKITLTYKEHGSRLSKEQFQDMTDDIEQVISMLKLIKKDAPCLLDGLKLYFYST